MPGVLEGFVVLAIVIGVGYLLARTGVLGESAQESLARSVFYVGTPALLFKTLSGADIHAVLGRSLLVAAGSAALVMLAFAGYARVAARLPVAETVIGCLATGYVNAGNLGLPLMVYVFGDGSLVAPMLLLQLLVMAPVSFVVLDTVTSGRRPTVRSVLAQPLKNPVVIASAIGVAVALLGWHPPSVVTESIGLLAGLAVPGALLAYGISLSTGPRPMQATSRAVVGVSASLKLLGQPLIAYLIGRALGMSGVPLAAAVVGAGLPTAQNVFVYATTYGRGTVIARDVIFVTMIASGPILLVLAALLH